MYKKLSKKSKGIFWSITIILLALLVYSITLIKVANVYELIIAALGWLYIFEGYLAFFNLLPRIFFAKKKWIMVTFSVVAILGIILAITWNIIWNTTRVAAALPITLIPATIVMAYLIAVLCTINKKKK